MLDNIVWALFRQLVGWTLLGLLICLVLRCVPVGTWLPGDALEMVTVAPNDPVAFPTTELERERTSARLVEHAHQEDDHSPHGEPSISSHSHIYSHNPSRFPRGVGEDDDDDDDHDRDHDHDYDESDDDDPHVDGNGEDAPVGMEISLRPSHSSHSLSNLLRPARGTSPRGPNECALVVTGRDSLYAHSDSYIHKDTCDEDLYQFAPVCSSGAVESSNPGPALELPSSQTERPPHAHARAALPRRDQARTRRRHHSSGYSHLELYERELQRLRLSRSHT
jgi:hypothetical protein